ncbi:MAG: response regulator [Syntrophaceae bacterium]|nr:response regulator [Syntrophaceae bacterium]
MKLRNIPIGIRLGLGLGLIGLILIVLILLSAWIINQDHQTMDSFVQRNHRQIWCASIVSDSVHSVREALTTYVHSRDEGQWSLLGVQLLTARATAGNALEEIEKLETAERGREILLQLKKNLALLDQESERVMKLQRRGEERRAQAEFLRQVHPLLISLHQHCRELITHQEQQTLLQRRAVADKHADIEASFLLFASIAIGIAVLLGVHMTRSVTVPLRNGVHIADRLAEGDLSLDIRVDRKDEAGKLLEAMKNMVARLRETKDLEQQLRQSQKLETVGRLAGGIAHDFNNVLGVILGSAELIRTSRPLDETVVRHSRSIENAVRKASGFVRPLLAFSRQQTLNLETVDIHSVLAEFHQMAQRVIGVHIELSMSLHPAPLMVHADVSQLNQVLLNLLVNARDAMPDGGAIVFETFPLTVDASILSPFPDAKAADYVVLTVSDTGVGISADIRERIFEPFFTTKKGGTGLGLSIVYGIVKQHGGFIDARNNPGGGTSFRVFLPAMPTGEESVLACPRQAAAEQGNESILLVEDNEDLRRTTEEILTMLGYSVTVAADGVEGVEVFRREQGKIDLVLMDVMMPRMGGLEAYTRMKELQPGLSTLFVTGCGVSDLPVDIRDGGSLDWIQKPFTVDDLSFRLREILRRRQMNEPAGLFEDRRQQQIQAGG